MTMQTSYGGAAPKMMGIIWTLLILATSLTTLRGFVAGRQAGKLRWDFVLAFTACIFGLVTTIFMTIECMYGVGSHITDVPLDNIPQILHMFWAGVGTGLVALTASKLSIVALLLHITAHKVQPARRALLWCFGGLTLLINFVQLILTLTQCSPFSHLWQRFQPGSCPRAVLADDYGFFQGAWGVFADFFLALYPITIVWDLQVSRRTKLVFCSLMATGVIPTAAACMRIVYLKRLVDLEDISYSLYPFATWGMAEVWTMIIIGNVPPLRPLYERVAHGKKSTSPSSGSERVRSTPRPRDTLWDDADDAALVTELTVSPGKA